jgi:hypothetical protein
VRFIRVGAASLLRRTTHDFVEISLKAALQQLS